MRCFPDKLMVLFQDVIIDLYMLTVVSFLSRNILTALYVVLPSGNTRYQNIRHFIRISECVYKCKGLVINQVKTVNNNTCNVTLLEQNLSFQSNVGE